MLYNIIEKKLTLKNGTMDHVAFGYGKKPIVVIPGLSLRRVKGSGLMLAQLFKLFCKDHRIVVFDRRDDVCEGITAKDFADDIAEGMELLGIRRAHVIGISQGGMIAQYLALDHPEKVARLVLAVTLCRPNDTLREAVNAWVSHIESGDMTAFLDDMLHRCYTEEYAKKFEKVFPVMIRFIDVIPKERFIALANSCLSCDTYDRLDGIKSPVLVIGADRDKVVSGEASRELAERLGCELYMYGEYGHSVNEEAKDFYPRIYDFLTTMNEHFYHSAQ